MTVPFIDFTGHMSAGEKQQEDISALQQSLDKLQSEVEILATMNIALSGDAILTNTPAGPNSYQINSGVVATVAHNLGYIPHYLGFLKYDRGGGIISYQKFPNLTYFYTGAPGTQTYQANSFRLSADTVNLYLTFDTTTSSIIFNGLGIPTMKYYIFAQPQAVS